jgi:Glyoxalase-like domain
MAQRRALDAVDHLLLGAADLDRGIAWLEERTGVTAAPGGVHPGRGTRNALASLGGRQYLEIIAPDPAQDVFEFPIDLRSLAEPRLVTWAAVTPDVDGVATAARAAGFGVLGPRNGSRTTPGGAVLRWRSLGIDAGFAGIEADPVPFFIEWSAETAHPSRDAPSGLRLVAVEVRHPKPGDLCATLATLGIDAVVEDARTAGFGATFDTPKGHVIL